MERYYKIPLGLNRKELKDLGILRVEQISDDTMHDIVDELTEKLMDSSEYDDVIREVANEVLDREYEDKHCDSCNKSLTDLEYANRGGNCDTCQPSLL